MNIREKLISEDLIFYYMQDYSLCIENISDTLYNIEEELTKTKLEELISILFKMYPLAKEILLPSCTSISKDKYLKYVRACELRDHAIKLSK